MYSFKQKDKMMSEYIKKLLDEMEEEVTINQVE